MAAGASMITSSYHSAGRSAADADAGVYQSQDGGTGKGGLGSHSKSSSHASLGSKGAVLTTGRHSPEEPYLITMGAAASSINHRAQEAQKQVVED